MLAATGEELNASHLHYTMPRLVKAIADECPHLTRLSVKIGTTKFLGQYYEDDYDKDVKVRTYGWREGSRQT